MLFTKFVLLGLIAIALPGNEVLAQSLPDDCVIKGDGFSDSAKERFSEDTEQKEYNNFYLACTILLLLIELAGGAYLISLDDLKWGNVIFVLVVGMRTFDMMSDWAFFAIPLHEDSVFVQCHPDGELVRGLTAFFSVVGLLLWIPDVRAYMTRVKDADTDSWTPALLTFGVALVEDIPQLCLNIVYLSYMGMEDADGIAIISFIMSFISLGSNAYIGLREAGFIAHEGKGSEAAAARRQSLKDYMEGRTMRLAALACLSIAMIFAIAIPATALFEGKTASSLGGSSTADLGGGEKVDLVSFSRNGIWTNKNLNTGESQDSCDLFEALADEYDCLQAQLDKCRTTKAFSILGVFSTAAALVLAFRVSFEGSALCSLFAAFSYMIIWTIAAHNWNADVEIDDSNCGLGYGDSDGVQYGASFYLSLANWFLLPAAAWLALCAGEESGGTSGWTSAGAV